VLKLVNMFNVVLSLGMVNFSFGTLGVAFGTLRDSSSPNAEKEVVISS
jgi:hypothetical protein